MDFSNPITLENLPEVPKEYVSSAFIVSVLSSWTNTATW